MEQLLISKQLMPLTSTEPPPSGARYPSRCQILGGERLARWRGAAFQKNLRSPERLLSEEDARHGEGRGGEGGKTFLNP